MKIEEAREKKKNWRRSEIIRCQKCGEYGVRIYIDPFNPSCQSKVWTVFLGSVEWNRTRYVCGKCGGDFEQVE